MLKSVSLLIVMLSSIKLSAQTIEFVLTASDNTYELLIPN